MMELVRTLAVLAEPPGPEHAPLAAAAGIPRPAPADHTDLFVFQLFPYASVHLGPEGKVGGVAQDRVAGFLRALGQVPPAEPDHLAFMLSSYAAVLEQEHEASEVAVKAFWEHARGALLVEHLLSWVPALLQRVADLGSRAYRDWGALVDDVLATEALRTPGTERSLPRHLAEAPPLSDPRHGGTNDFVDELLTPARTGLILTVTDLARAAEDLHLGRRVGERRFVIRGLLDQDAGGLLAWLGGTAQRTAEGWSQHWLAATPIGEWWRDRAARTAALLDELGGEIRAVEQAPPVGIG